MHHTGVDTDRDPALETLLLRSPAHSPPNHSRFPMHDEMMRPDVVAAADGAHQFAAHPLSPIAIGQPAIDSEHSSSPHDHCHHEPHGEHHHHHHHHAAEHVHAHHGESCAHAHAKSGWRRFLPHSHALETRLAADTHSLRMALLILVSAFLLQLVAGLLASSSALIVEAVHSALDGLTVVISLISVMVALGKPTAQFSYGYARAEVISALLSITALALLCIKLFYGATERLFHILRGSMAPIHVEGRIVFVAEAITLCANVFMAYVLTSGGQTSLNIRALRAHVIADSVENLIVLFAGLIMWIMPSASIIDPILTLFIVALIMYLNAGIASESIMMVMQAAPSSINVEQSVLQNLEKIPAVAKVGPVHVWTMTSGTVVATAEVFVDEDAAQQMSFLETDSVRQEVEKVLTNAGAVETTVQISRIAGPSSSESDEIDDLEKKTSRSSGEIYHAVDPMDSIV